MFWFGYNDNNIIKFLSIPKPHIIDMKIGENQWNQCIDIGMWGKNVCYKFSNDKEPFIAPNLEIRWVLLEQ